MASQGERIGKLSEECQRIEEDCDFSRRTMWNDRDAVDRYVNRISTCMTVFKALQGVTAAGAFVQAAKMFSLGEAPLAGVALVTLPVVYVLESLLETERLQNLARTCHGLGSEYHSLMAQTRFFREHRLQTFEAEAALASVEDFEKRKLEIDARRPHSLFDPQSYLRARDSIRDGQSLYRVDTVPRVSSSRE